MAPHARADHEETEARLKLAGVKDDVRARIAHAIGEGVDFLLSRQSKDGGFRPDGGAGDAAYRDGMTALASLALAHAGGGRARAGAAAGASFLVRKGVPCDSAVTWTYAAGLSAMLLDALREDAGAARRIGAALAAGLDERTEWWGYALEAPDAAAALTLAQDDANLSTSQFGALGLWAAGRRGGVHQLPAWRRHLVALCALQTDSGSWPYWAAVREKGAGRYPNGTTMGFANLTLARAALEEDLADDPALAARGEIAARRARRALDLDGPLVLDLGAQDGAIDYYGFYALEKACVFAAIERVGGRAWYLAGAGRLLAAQGKDGGWRCGPAGVGVRSYDEVVATSFALLFLLRASEGYRPVTPREIDRTVETPGGDPPRAGERAEPPPPEAFAFDLGPALDRIAAALAKSRAPPGELLGALEDFARARGALDTDAPPQWRDRAEHLLLRVLDTTIRPGAPRGDARAAERAAALLGEARPAVAGPLRSVLRDALASDATRPPSRAVLGAAFGALARHGGDATFAWLVERVTASTRRNDVRGTRAALHALADFRGARGADRLRAAQRIARELEPVERTAALDEADDSEDFDRLAARALHSSLGAPALIALERLASDAASGAPPRASDGSPLVTIAAYARWLESHRDPSAPPWR